LQSTSRAEREKERKIEEIRDAAESLFVQKGYHGTTMDEIAAKSEFTKRTVYGYFGSKEELLAAVTAKAFRLLNGYFKAALEKLPPAHTASQALRELAGANVHFACEHPAHFKLITDYQGREIAPRNRFEDECFAEGEISFGLLLSTVQKGQAAGEFTRDTPAELLSLFLWEAVIGLQTLLVTKTNYLTHHFQVSGEALTESFLVLVERALQPQEE